MEDKTKGKKRLFARIKKYKVFSSFVACFKTIHTQRGSEKQNIIREHPKNRHSS